MSEVEPEKPIVFYDSECGVCSAIVRKATDRYSEVQFCPSTQLTDANKIKRANREMLLTTDNSTVGGMDAVREILRTGGRFSRFIAIVLTFPIIRTGAHLFYRLVANNRPRISRWLHLKSETNPTQ